MSATETVLCAGQSISSHPIHRQAVGVGGSIITHNKSGQTTEKQQTTLSSSGTPPTSPLEWVNNSLLIARDERLLLPGTHISYPHHPVEYLSQVLKIPLDRLSSINRTPIKHRYRDRRLHSENQDGRGRTNHPLYFKTFRVVIKRRLIH